MSPSPRSGTEPEEVSFDPSWRGFGGIHGGYVLASMLRVATLATGREVATATAHFHAPVAAGAATLSVSRDATGLSATSVSVELSQDKLRASAKVFCTEGFTPPPPPPAIFMPGPEVPPPESLAPVAMPLSMVPFAQHVEIRLVGTGPFAGASTPELTAWVRLCVPQPYDAPTGAVLLDAIPPSLYAIMAEPVPIPTVELTAHFVPGATGTTWMLLSQQTVWASGGWCVDEANLRSAHGELVAQARQLRRIRRGTHPRTTGI